MKGNNFGRTLLTALLVLAAVPVQAQQIPFRSTRKAAGYAQQPKHAAKSAKDMRAALQQDLRDLDAALAAEEQAALPVTSVEAVTLEMPTVHTPELVTPESAHHDGTESLTALHEVMDELEEDFQLFIKDIGGHDTTSRPASAGASTDSDDETASADASKISTGSSSLSLYSTEDDAAMRKVITRLHEIAQCVRQNIERYHESYRFKNKISKQLDRMDEQFEQSIATINQLIAVVRGLKQHITMIAMIWRAGHRSVPQARGKVKPQKLQPMDVHAPLISIEHWKLDEAIDELNDAGLRVVAFADNIQLKPIKPASEIQFAFDALERNAGYARQVLDVYAHDFAKAPRSLQKQCAKLAECFNAKELQVLIKILKMRFLEGSRSISAITAALQRQTEYLYMLEDLLFDLESYHSTLLYTKVAR